MICSPATSPVIFDQDGVLGHSLAKVGGLEYLQIVLAPGAAVPRHALPFAIEFYVVAGQGAILLAEGEAEMVSQQLVRVEAGEPRGWRNIGEGELVLLGIKHIAGT